MPRFRTSSSYGFEHHLGRHRFEHWYRDNTIYFITARCRDRYPAFASDRAKEIFWERFDYWRGTSDHDYFDGCLRNQLQCRRTYCYILT